MARKGSTSFRKENKVTEVRVEKWRKYNKFLLVVCEDQKTEPKYIETFQKQFPEHTMYLEIVGAGLDPLGVVNNGIQKKKDLAGITKREIDEVWVIFDKDDADLNQARINRFNSAFDIAKENKFNIAWSNEVFELWLLLHFVDIDPMTPLSRVQIYTSLRDTINTLLEDNVINDGHSNPNILQYLQSHGSEKDATSRAEILLNHHNTTPPLSANPATQMHLLVKTLRDWIAYYSYIPS